MHIKTIMLKKYQYFWLVIKLIKIFYSCERANLWKYLFWIFFVYVLKLGEVETFSEVSVAYISISKDSYGVIGLNNNGPELLKSMWQPETV